MPLVTVSEITAYLKELFQIDPVLADIWVRGEASNISRPASGHLYFSLKDPDAALRCVCFKQQARYLSYLPDEGDAVLAHGRIGIYEASGQYQLYIDLIQPDGVGLLAAQFERLRMQLEMEGLFDEARKRPLAGRAAMHRRRHQRVRRGLARYSDGRCAPLPADDAPPRRPRRCKAAPRPPKSCAR